MFLSRLVFRGHVGTQEKNVGNYDQLVDYLSTIVPGGIEDWWQKYCYG